MSAGVKACRIEPQLLSKLGAQALVLLSASHSYSSAVGRVVRRFCPAPDGKGRFVIRATRERGVGVPPESELCDGIS
jgi:hypothetical protein